MEREARGRERTLLGSLRKLAVEGAEVVSLPKALLCFPGWARGEQGVESGGSGDVYLRMLVDHLFLRF